MNKWLVEVIDSKGRVLSHDFVYAKSLEDARNLGQKLVELEPVASALGDVIRPGNIAEEKSQGRARGRERFNDNWRPQGRWRVPGPAYDNVKARLRVNLVRTYK